MADERIRVLGLHHFRRARQRCVGVTLGADGEHRWGCGQFLRACRNPRRADLGRRPLVPLDLQLAARRLGGPPVIRDDRDAAMQAEHLVRAFDHEGLAHARQRANLVQVGRLDLAGKDRALLVRRPQHPRQREIDAEQRLARDDERVVHAADRRADDAVLGGGLHRNGLQVGHRHRGERRRQGSVPEGAVGRRVTHSAVRGRALGGGHAPTRGGRRDEHLSSRRADTPERLPVGRRRGAAARSLRPIGRLVEARLLDRHLCPVDVEFLRNQHRQHRLDALADLRVLGHDGDAAIGSHLDERGRRERWRRRSPGRRRLASGDQVLGVEGKHDAPASERRDAQEGAASDLSGHGGSHRRTSCWPARPALGAVGLPLPVAAAFLIASRMRR